MDISNLNSETLANIANDVNDILVDKYGLVVCSYELLDVNLLKLYIDEQIFSSDK